MKKGYIILAVLVLYTLVVFLPPIIHGYVYPNNGDDTAFHLAYFDGIRNGDNSAPQYLGQNIVGFPLVWISNVFGLSVDTLFLWFNFIMLWLVGISGFALIAKFVDWRAGLLAIPMVMFMTPSTMNLYDTGAVYDLVTIGVILPLLLFSGMQLWSSRKWYWAIPLLVLSGMVVMMHTTVIFKVIVAGNPTGEVAIPTLAEFFGILLGYASVMMFAMALVFLVWWHKNLSVDNKVKALAICFAIMVVAMTVLVFTGAIGWSLRIAIDLAILFPLFVACLLGIIIKIAKTKLVLYTSCLLVILVSMPIVVSYAQYNSAMKPIDMQAVAYVNSLPGEYYSCSSEVAPWIYDRFLNKEYKDGEYRSYG